MRLRSIVHLLLLAAFLFAAPRARAGNPGSPILFVTQVPMPEEVNTRDVTSSYMSIVSPFSNHLADTAHAGRGGSLFVRFPNGQLVDLLAAADWSAVPGGMPAANTVAVRNPSVSYDGTRALISMVTGAPSGPSDTTPFHFQLYEITLPTQAQLTANVKPVITVVPNQPPYDNVFPTYAPGGRIVFASSRPYDGRAHLLQREEYLGLPTTTGLYSLDPSDASSLMLLFHSPSGAFHPSVDSAGRVLFSNWDHLSRDPQAVTDSRAPVVGAPYNETFVQTFNGAGNFASESNAAVFTQVTAMSPESWDIFPEPRNFDHVTLIDVYASAINGNSQNVFLPWTVNLDGTNSEILNHVGRHEIGAGFSKSFRNDANVVDLNPLVAPGYGGLVAHKFVNNFLAPREDPLVPGRYFGTDGADLGTHGAGQIVRLDNAGLLPNGTPMNPDAITVTYVTSGANGAAKPGFIPTVRGSMSLPPTGQTALSAANAESLFRTPLPLTDGNLVASHAASVTQTDYNTGTAAQPASLFTFRLKSLKASGATFVPDVTLTAGINIDVSYYVGATLVTYDGPAWELDPVEIAPRAMPTAQTSGVDPIEASVFASAGVHIPTFQAYLRAQNAALTVSRDVTRRDLHDRQQPFNLRVTWSNHQSVGAPGTVYDVAWLRVLEGDLRRGYLLGNAQPAPGRRVVATPLHTTASENPATPGVPPGSVRLGDDGSFAAIVPARKALTWDLLDDTQSHTSQVKERFWVTFQPGEIRTCANCHGINTSDQTGSVASPVTRPTNPPLALASLLASWKLSHPAGSVALEASAVGVLRDAGTVSLTVARAGGSTGPASVDFATAAGTALAGTDYATTSGTLTWADGDTAQRTISITLANQPIVGAPRTFTVTLSNPTYAALGAQTSATVTVAEPDTGFDAGVTPADAGATEDAGVSGDASMTSDATTEDAGTTDGGTHPSSSCSCRAGASGGPSELGFVTGLVSLALVIVRRRAARARRTA